MARKKSWSSYAEYLKSDEFSEIKKEWMDKMNWHYGECIISGASTEDGDNGGGCFHHWRYPSDWNDDSWENIVYICQDLHNDIHIALPPKIEGEPKFSIDITSYIHEEDDEPANVYEYIFKMKDALREANGDDLRHQCLNFEYDIKELNDKLDRKEKLISLISKMLSKEDLLFMLTIVANEEVK